MWAWPERGETHLFFRCRHEALENRGGQCANGFRRRASVADRTRPQRPWENQRSRQRIVSFCPWLFSFGRPECRIYWSRLRRDLWLKSYRATTHRSRNGWFKSHVRARFQTLSKRRCRNLHDSFASTLHRFGCWLAKERMKHSCPCIVVTKFTKGLFSII